MTAERNEANNYSKLSPDAGGNTFCFSVRKFNNYAAALVITAIAIPFVVGKYIELSESLPWDSAAHVYSAQHILSGAQLGVEERTSIGVGTLLLNMLGVKLFGFSQTGPKVISLVLQAAALLAMFYSLSKLFGVRSASICAIIASIYISSPIVARDSLKEEYLSSFAVLGVSCFAMWQLTRRIWWGLLAGAFTGLAPLFKATGISALAAIGLYMLLQPLVQKKAWARAGKELLILTAGLLLAVGPVCLWLAHINAPKGAYPYSFILKLSLPGCGAFVGDYITRSHSIYPFTNQLQEVLRCYRKLIVPIGLASAAVILGIIRFARRKRPVKKKRYGYECFVLLFAIWWILDMAFVWISPRSYWHYYLPLNGSAAMLSGYVFALYYERASSSLDKKKWRNTGLIGIICLIALSWTVLKNYGNKFAQVVEKQMSGSKEPWQVVGQYIREHSSENDKMYVWGWMPGIYVEAQRSSPTPRACTSEMHIMSPQKLSDMVHQISDSFEKCRPKFIVDSRKIHFPWDRPQLELWPITKEGPLSKDKKQIQAYDEERHKMLKENFGADAAAKYEALKLLREFIMENYEIVPGPFGEHVLFRLKNNY